MKSRICNILGWGTFGAITGAGLGEMGLYAGVSVACGGPPNSTNSTLVQEYYSCRKNKADNISYYGSSSLDLINLVTIPFAVAGFVAGISYGTYRVIRYGNHENSRSAELDAITIDEKQNSVNSNYHLLVEPNNAQHHTYGTMHNDNKKDDNKIESKQIINGKLPSTRLSKHRSFHLWKTKDDNIVLENTHNTPKIPAPRSLDDSDTGIEMMPLVVRPNLRYG